MNPINPTNPTNSIEIKNLHIEPVENIVFVSFFLN